MNPLIFETMSVCAAFSVFPDVASSPLSAAAKLAVVSCCAVDDSATLSCGATNGDCGLLGSAATGGGVATRGRRGDGEGNVAAGAAGSSRNSGGSSCASKPELVCAGGICGCTTDAVAHGSVGRLRSAHPLTKSATEINPIAVLVAAFVESGDGSGRILRDSDRTGLSVMN